MTIYRPCLLSNLFFDEGAHVKEVTSVYPTVTYTCHTSLSTGHYPPHAHGIFNNELPQPHKASVQDWHWFEKDIKVPTFFDYAKQANLTTAAILWPVMAGADITYNIPEIWSPDHTISRTKLFLDYGTKNVLWPVAKYRKLLNGTKQPYLDNFSEAAALHIIKKKKPDLVAIHFTDLDTMRHLHGLNSQEGRDAIVRIDKRIGNIIDLYKKLGLHDKTDYVLLGDHGTHDFDKVIELNSYFADYGLLKVDDNKTITQWQVYACTCGGSCQIHIHKDAEDKIRHNVKSLLEKLLAMDSSPPISNVYTREEAMTEHYLDGGDFDYIVEAKDKHVFRNTVGGTLVHDSKENSSTYIGDHGYLPSHRDQKNPAISKRPFYQTRCCSRIS